MGYKKYGFKKRATKKRAFRKGRKYVKKAKVANFARPGMIYKIPLRIPAAEIVVDSDPTQAGALGTIEYAVSLGNIVANELAAFTELYDEFKITGFKVQLKPRGNMNTAAGPVQGFHFYSVLDGTDLVPLADIAAAQEYTNCKTHQSWRGMSRYVKCTIPKLTRDVNNNPVLKIEGANWMQLLPQTISGVVYNNANVAHIGLKVIFEYNNNTTDVIFDEYITCYCQFRTKK